jgi:DNA-binding NtrC family response regulator
VDASNAVLVPEVEDKPTILFIDDEHRVLKSMRAMFRKHYNVCLANSGAEALEIMAEQAVDVVVSDQRMPTMTGVEVLTEIKVQYPLTQRILLTGYADLDAVEASMNEAEVFRYLMKPCPANEIRSALDAALNVSSFAAVGAVSAASAVASDPDVDFNADQSPEQNAEAESSPLDEADKEGFAAASRPAVASVTRLSQRPVRIHKPERKRLLEGAEFKVHICVLSDDEQLCLSVEESWARQKFHIAETLDEVIELIHQQRVGVLVTDMVGNEATLQSIVRGLSVISPHTVLVLASHRSDASFLIKLINSGKVFRFLLKPVHTAQCKIWLASAARKFLEAAETTQFDELTPTSPWRRFFDWLLGR